MALVIHIPVVDVEALEAVLVLLDMLLVRHRMVEMEKPDQYTEIIYDAMDFDVKLEDRMFTLFALQSSRGS